MWDNPFLDPEVDVSYINMKSNHRRPPVTDLRKRVWKNVIRYSRHPCQPWGDGSPHGHSYSYMVCPDCFFHDHTGKFDEHDCQVEWNEYLMRQIHDS